MTLDKSLLKEKLLQYQRLGSLIVAHIQHKGLGAFLSGVVKRLKSGQSKHLLMTLNKLHKLADYVDYEDWVKKYDTLSQEQLQKMTQQISRFEHNPVISIIMPVYNPPIDLLKQAINSIKKQCYSNWELCIADDASTDPQVQKILEQFQNVDPRIKVSYRKENGHISASSNSALKLVTGEFVALLDNDDLLPQDALFWVAKAINENPNVKMIYSDEDKININGQRYGAYFKPDWNHSLFLSQNMFSHLGVFNSQLLRSIGGFRLGYEGSQDYDLALRCLQYVSSEQIIHIPKVLYHWRAIPGSTAIANEEKPYAKIAGERSIKDYLSSINIDAKVEATVEGYRIRYSLPAIPALVSIFIIVKNSNEVINECVDNLIKQTTYSNYEIIIMLKEDNLSFTLDKDNPDTQLKIITVDADKNEASLYNEAVKQSNGEMLLFLCDDLIQFSENWLEEMLSLFVFKNVGAVGAKLLFSNEKIHHAGVILGLTGIAGYIHHNLAVDHVGYCGRAKLTQEFSALSGDCLLVKKSCFEQVGGFEADQLASNFTIWIFV